MRAGQALKRAAVAAGLWACACSPSPEEEALQETTAPGISDETLAAIEGGAAGGEELVSFTVPADELISGDGIGGVEVGTTLGALGDVIGDRAVRFEQSYADDLSAVCVDDDDGSELYCAAFARAARPSESSVVTLVATRHPKFRTQEGVGPGVSVEDAAEVYGDAFLTLSADGGAEYVEFDRGPPGTVGFRPASPDDPHGLVGTYEDDEEGVRETDVYRPGAIIAEVEVVASGGP